LDFSTAGPCAGILFLYPRQPICSNHLADRSRITSILMTRWFPRQYFWQLVLIIKNMVKRNRIIPGLYTRCITLSLDCAGSHTQVALQARLPGSPQLLCTDRPSCEHSEHILLTSVTHQPVMVFEQMTFIYARGIKNELCSIRLL
jgi:hypothetical protein